MQLINKTKTIDEKSAAIFNKVIGEYNHGEIKSETELLYKLFNALKDFYASIGRPTFKYRVARGTPVSGDYNSMIEESIADIRSLIEDANNMNGVLEQSFNEIELDRKMLQNRIKYIYRLLSKLKVAVQNNRNGQLFSDSFINTKNMDTSIISGSPASINVTEGVLTLNKIESNDYSNTCTVEILPTSNGFPGNTHIVDTLDGDMKFAGEDNMHINLGDIIDGNNDTWFEYEIFNVDNNVYETTLGLGFNYKENVEWITDESILRLGVRLTLKNPKQCNWLSLNPFIPEHKGAASCVIKNIVISDGKGTIQNITNGKRVFDGDIIYIFQSQICKTVTIEFEQTIPYIANVGHFYFNEVTSSNELYYEDSAIAGRVDGPVPSIEALGLKYDSRAKAVIHPNTIDAVSFINEANTKKELFNLPVDSKTIKGFKEYIYAYRYQIGLKGINISSCKFGSTSEYTSISYVSDKLINSISIDSSELIPSSYSNGEWIKYYISVDEGKTWYNIVPTFKAHTGKSVYYINSKTPIELRHSSNGYIETSYDVYNVRLKIELSRPTTEGFEYTTPIVYGYNIKTITGGNIK